MHLTLKNEATKPAAANVFQQQARFDAFVEQYNRDRPHQGLAMQVPAEVYGRSARVYRGLEELTYPFHDATFTVTQCGRICFKARKVNLSHVFAGCTGLASSNLCQPQTLPCVFNDMQRRVISLSHFANDPTHHLANHLLGTVMCCLQSCAYEHPFSLT